MEEVKKEEKPIETPPVQPEKLPSQEELLKVIQQQQFFSDQPAFNALIYQGLDIILQKLTKIEEKINGNTK